MIIQPFIPIPVILVYCIALLTIVVILVIKAKTFAQRLSWIRRGMMVVLVGLMLIGFSIPGGHSQAGLTNLNVFFLVDTTTSMGAEDYSGNNERIEGVKNDIISIVEKLPGARFTIITFDRSVSKLLPMTSDRAAVISTTRTVAREPSVYSLGSSIDIAVPVVIEQLKSEKTKYPNRTTALFYFGDGEQTADAKAGSFSELKPYISSGAVLGYGTTTGGNMRYFSGVEYKDYKMSYILSSYYPEIKAVSKIDEAALKKIASELGVTYVNRNSGGPVDKLIDESNSINAADASRAVSFYLNLYFLFAIPLVILMAWEAYAQYKAFRTFRAFDGRRQK